MSDVLQTALNYRNRLKSELTKVEEFLRMAEEFSKDRDIEARFAFAKADPGTKGQSPIDRLRPAPPSKAASA